MAHRRSLVIGVVVALTVLGLAGTAQASDNSGPGSRDHQTVKLYDDCDPTTFNAQPIPGQPICRPGSDGETTFDAFIAELLATGQVDGWFFEPRYVEIKKGGVLDLESRGGETHSFTRVATFGGGCVGLPERDKPVPECAGFATALFVPSGGTAHVSVGNTPGVQLYQCLIHGWMRTTVKVTADSSGRG